MNKFVLMAFMLVAFTAGGAAFALTRITHNQVTQVSPDAVSGQPVANAAPSGTFLSRTCEQQQSLCDLLAY
jgi:hypothetical protein